MKQYDMGTERIPTLFAAYAIPASISMLGMALFLIVDGIVVGQFVGASGLAAVNLSMPAVSLAAALGVMVTSGGIAQTTMAMGEGKLQSARDKFSVSFAMISVIAIAYMILPLIFGRQIAMGLGAQGDLIEPVKHYVQIMGLGSLFYAGGALLDAGVRAMGKPHISMIGMVTSALINIVLDIWFVAFLDLGVEGAAAGSVIGFVFGFMIYLVQYFKKDAVLRFVKPVFRKREVGKILANGSSEALNQLSIAITTLLFNLILMARMGEIGVSALSIVLYINDILISIFVGLANAMIPIMSYNYGAGLHRRVKSISRISLITVAVIGGGTALLMVLFRTPLVLIFNSSDGELIRIAAVAVCLYAPAFIFNGANIFGSAYFTARGDAVRSASISGLRSLVMVCLGLMIFPALMGNNGIWIAVPFAELTTLVITGTMLRKSFRRYGSLSGIVPEKIELQSTN